ncbi:uncharacterized protein P174DRAFT_33527 [Aspergillus novofumigatus IBT 16806]|uniref:Uncharacterized protein n=1 Tax=Aspergillus novofumigatus (strain IBT 16806) TaxID=1392255 RepID=A0A2I1CMQ9_ASPN1|nr:uncharacterized protein P174DRAFT_33527 [Aspergillus novofumigatus IBT 16806]PKX98921.1 hypothetical protein P174DRAFT_33527 [Aspergillus novofumigatus IBT 16806]
MTDMPMLLQCHHSPSTRNAVSSPAYASSRSQRRFESMTWIVSIETYAQPSRSTIYFLLAACCVAAHLTKRGSYLSFLALNTTIYRHNAA